MSVFVVMMGLGLTAGALIGCAGIGGVIIVPILVQAAGFPVYTAVSIAMAGYVLTGIVGTCVYAREGTLDWRLARFLAIGAMPAAVCGAVAAHNTPAPLLELLIALLTASSGLHSLLRRPNASEEKPHLTVSPPVGLMLGGAAGFLSSLTGTGGPAVLIPLLLWMKTPILKAVGLAQAIQLPIAVLATIENAAAGTIDVPLSVGLGIGLTTGTWIGARIAHRIDQKVLRIVVVSLLLGVGTFLAVKIGGRYLFP